MEEQRYLWAAQIAEKWKVSAGWVCQLCREGRINGAFFRSGRWSVPADAEKPADLRRPQNKVRRHRVRPTLLPVPFRMESEAEEPSKRLLDELNDLAAYTTDYIDLSPASGRFLLAVLAYPHVRAYALCSREIEYIYLTSMRDCAPQIYGRVSILMLEYFALGNSDRKAYFYEKRDIFNSISSNDRVEYVALALFLCAVSAKGAYTVDENGLFCGTHGRKKYTPAGFEYENFCAIASSLSSAQIFPPSEEPFLLAAEDSFLMLHASRGQDKEEHFSHYFNTANRVLFDEEI